MSKKTDHSSAVESVRAAERQLNEAVDHAKQLKAKSRDAKRKMKQAKAAAKQAAKAARKARKAAEQAHHDFRKARERASKQSNKRRESTGADRYPEAPVDSRAEEPSARRRSASTRPGSRIGAVGEETADVEVAELP
jgi:ABC-type transporter Mla subunit MlaD